MKSPNMMSTTGRMPVMAAPTPMPAIPASEIGESITRCAPNSSTKPDKTLNGVPASATSSPIMKTRGSRRISSASASLIAWPKVSSRTGEFKMCCGCALSFPFPEKDGEGVLGIDMLSYFVGLRIRRVERESHRGFDFLRDFVFDFRKRCGVHQFISLQPIGEQLEWISLLFPLLFFLF